MYFVLIQKNNSSYSTSFKDHSKCQINQEQCIPLAYDNKLDINDRYFILNSCNNKLFSG